MVVPEEVWKQIETLQDLLSHRVPTRSCGELIALLARDAMAKYDPRCRGKGLRARAAAPQAAAGQSSTAPVRDLAGVTPRARPTDRGARPAPEAVLASRHIDAATARSPAASVRASVPADTAHGQVPGGPAPATAAAGIAAPLADQCSTPAQAELDVRQETPGTGLAGQPAQPATPAPEYATAKAVYRHAPCPRRGPARRVGA